MTMLSRVIGKKKKKERKNVFGWWLKQLGV